MSIPKPFSIIPVACCLMTAGCTPIETNDVATNRLSFISNVQFTNGVAEVVTRIAGGLDDSGGVTSYALSIPVSTDEQLQGRLGTETKRFISRPIPTDDGGGQNSGTPGNIAGAASRMVEHYVAFPGNSSTQMQLSFTRANGAVFSRNVELPAPITLVSPSPSQVLSIGQDITVTWDASGYPSDENMIVWIEGNPQQNCLMWLETHGAPNTGSFTLPAGTIAFNDEFTGNQCQVSVKVQTSGSVGLYPPVNDGLKWEINILSRNSNAHNVTLTR